MMTDERLAELERRLECPGLLVDEARELIAEVRRLRGILREMAGAEEVERIARETVGR